jgi:hypothetical protein
MNKSRTTSSRSRVSEPLGGEQIKWNCYIVHQTLLKSVNVIRAGLKFTIVTVLST